MCKGKVLKLSFCDHNNINASVNPSCAQTPLPPPPSPGLTPICVLPWMANSSGWGLLSCQIPRGGDEKRGQMPCPPSTLQPFFIDCIVEECHFKHFNVLFFCFIIIINLYLYTKSYHFYMVFLGIVCNIILELIL